MAKTARLAATTRLSGSRREGGVKCSRFLVLARLSLSVLALSMFSGCLIEDPPPLQKAKQTPPRLDYQGARPLMDQIITAQSNERIPFTIPVTSEDAGEGLIGYLFLDYMSGVDPGTLLAFPNNLAPSTLNDTSERAFKFTWPVNPMLKGCYRITLLAGHTSTLFDPSNIVDSDDLAVAHWWANVNVTPDSSDMLRDCPDASRPQGNKQ
jgi:hypothetical protein